MAWSKETNEQDESKVMGFCKKWDMNTDIDPITKVQLPKDSKVYEFYKDFCKNEDEYCEKFSNDRNINPVSGKTLREGGKNQLLLRKSLLMNSMHFTKFV